MCLPIGVGDSSIKWLQSIRLVGGDFYRGIAQKLSLHSASCNTIAHLKGIILGKERKDNPVN